MKAAIVSFSPPARKPDLVVPVLTILQYHTLGADSILDLKTNMLSHSVFFAPSHPSVPTDATTKDQAQLKPHRDTAK